ncbi:MAG: hypothetical protein ABMB14_00885 [Myxococcota bacterium]
MDAWLLLSLTGVVCVGAAGAAAMLVAVVLSGWRRRARAAEERAATAAIEQAAVAHELAPVNPGVWEGRIRGRRVRWTLREVAYAAGPRLQLAVGTPVPTGNLALTHRTMDYGAVPPELELPLGRIGDPEFDVRFFIHADLEHLSLLTPPVRKALLTAGSDAEPRIRSGWLWLDHPATRALGDSAGARIDALFAVATALDEVQAEVEHRVRRLSQDPIARVRGRALEMLAVRGASDFTSWIAKPLLNDLDPTVRVRAAETLGDAEQLGALIGDRTLGAAVRRRAATALSGVGTPSDRLAAAKVLARAPAALPDLALDLCRGLGETAEGVLIELVQSDVATVARRAVGQLAHTGSARSLVILQAVVDADARPTLVRMEARQVLDTLRGRSKRTPVPADRAATPGTVERTPAPANRSGAIRRPGSRRTDR